MQDKIYTITVGEKIKIVTTGIIMVLFTLALIVLPIILLIYRYLYI